MQRFGNGCGALSLLIITGRNTLRKEAREGEVPRVGTRPQDGSYAGPLPRAPRRREDEGLRETRRLREPDQGEAGRAADGQPESGTPCLSIPKRPPKGAGPRGQSEPRHDGLILPTPLDEPDGNEVQDLRQREERRGGANGSRHLPNLSFGRPHDRDRVIEEALRNPCGLNVRAATESDDDTREFAPFPQERREDEAR